MKRWFAFLYIQALAHGAVYVLIAQGYQILSENLAGVRADRRRLIKVTICDLVFGDGKVEVVTIKLIARVHNTIYLLTFSARERCSFLV